MKQNSDSETTARAETFGFVGKGRWSGDVITDQRVLNDINETPTTPHCIVGSCYDPFAPTGFSSGDRRMNHSEWRSRTIAKWDFKKVACFGVVKRAKGDVTITAPSDPEDGPGGDVIGPSPEGPITGCVTNLDGAVITTGSRSRVSLDMDQYRLQLGSNSKWEFGDDPCQTKPVDRTIGQQIKGFLIVTASKLSGPVTLHIANSPSGVRGDLNIPPHDGGEGIVFAALRSSSPAEREVLRHGAVAATFVTNSWQRYGSSENDRQDHGQPWLREEARGEIALSEAELAGAEVAFLVDSQPAQYLYVEVLKGSMTLGDSSGAQRRLEEGESFSKLYPPHPRPSDFKDVFATIGGP